MNAPTSFKQHMPTACPMCGAPARPKMMVAHIQATVASYYGIRVQYMWSAQRGRDVAWPRQVAMFLSRELTPMSLPAIGKRFGGRDHTTVIHALKVIERRMGTDFELEEDITILRERLTAEREAAEDPFEAEPIQEVEAVAA